MYTEEGMALCVRLLRALANNTTFSRLELHGWNMTADVCAALVALLQSNTTLQSLALSSLVILPFDLDILAPSIARVIYAPRRNRIPRVTGIDLVHTITPLGLPVLVREDGRFMGLATISQKIHARTNDGLAAVMQNHNEEKLLGFVMASHKRLGEGADAHMLSSDTLEKIAKALWGYFQ